VTKLLQSKGRLPTSWFAAAPVGLRAKPALGKSMYSVLRILSLPDAAADALELALSANPAVSRIGNSLAITVAESSDIECHLLALARLWETFQSAFESLCYLNATVRFDVAVYESEYRNRVMKELVFPSLAMEYLTERKISLAVSVYGFFPDYGSTERCQEPNP
jgi:hypothetical protein